MVSRTALLLAMLAAAPAAAGQTTPREIAETADISGLAASPDGRWIAYRIERPSTATNRIDVDWYIAAADGSTPPRPLGRLGTALIYEVGVVMPGEAAWSPDSQALFVRALVDGRIALWRSRIDGSRFKPVVAGDGDIEAFAIQSDGAIIASEGPSREAIARAEDDEREDGILVDGQVDLAAPLYRGGLVNGRAATQRFTGDWFDRAPLLADRPRLVQVHDPITGSSRPASASEGASLPPPLPRASPEPSAGLRAKLLASGVCFEILGCAEGSRRLASTLPLGGDRTVVTLRDQALRETIYIWSPSTGALERLAETDGLFAGNRDEDAPCAATAAALFCVEATPSVAPRLVRIALDGTTSVIDTPNKFPDSDGLLAETIVWQVSGSRASGILIRPKIPGRLPLFITYYRCPGFVRGGLGDEYPLRAMAAKGIATLCINALPGPDTAEARYALGLKAVGAAIDHLADKGLVDRTRVGMGGLSFGSEVTMWTLMHSNLLKAAAIASASMGPAYFWFNARPSRKMFADNLRLTWNLGSPDADPSGWKHMSPAANTARMRAPVLMQLPESEARQTIELQSKLATARLGEMHIFPLAPHIKFEPRQKLAVYQRNLDWFLYWLKGEEDPDPAKSAQYARWSRLAPAERSASTDLTQSSTSAISSSR
ncbi:Atxe2 family lasso peptide isopeptidase [Sphingopyxis panaciterrae]